MPLPRYYYGVAPDVTVQTRVFVEWLFARIEEDAGQVGQLIAG
jgi:LysR family glycine cleavage system transcriptional activator